MFGSTNSLTKQVVCKVFKVWVLVGESVRHFISKEGVSADLANKRGCASCSSPKNVTKVRRLLGLAGYFKLVVAKERHISEKFLGLGWVLSSFCWRCSRIAQPMTSLMKKEKKFEWFDECDQAFVTLQERSTKTPILTLLDPKLDYLVYSDA